MICKRQENGHVLLLFNLKVAARSRIYAFLAIGSPTVIQIILAPRLVCRRTEVMALLSENVVPITNVLSKHRLSSFWRMKTRELYQSAAYGKG